MSNGLETYVQKGLIKDTQTLQDYINSQLYLLPYGDLGFAAKAASGCEVHILDALCAASKSPSELRNCTNKLCVRFLKNLEQMGLPDILRSYQADIQDKKCYGCYPVALGLYIRSLNLDPAAGLQAYCYSMLSAMVNHAVKLVPLRQMDGQRVLRDALQKIPEAVQTARNAEITELGTGGHGFELRSMQHETLYSRIYIS